MQNNKSKREIYPELEPAYLILDKISVELSSAGEDQQELQSALEGSLDRYDQAKGLFLAEGQPWLAVWVDLKKASLHCELAHLANAMGRAVQIHTAMELIKDVLGGMPDFPPNLDLAGKLYISILDSLFRIRPYFNKQEQLDALDDLIRGVAESLGETQALELSFLSQANDLNFTASILESMVELEEDPLEREELIKTSKDLYEQAADCSAITSAYDLTRNQEGK